VKEIIGALRNCQKLTLADECESFVIFHIKHLSDSCMTKMSKRVEGDWESLALTLGLSMEDLDKCRGEEGDYTNEEIAFNMLCIWRVSDVAISSGFDVFNDLLGRLENMPSSIGLTEYIRDMLIQIN
ncbi:hypothetical protein CHS0354_023148, partial [Potamilus streckersoni]